MSRMELIRSFITRAILHLKLTLNANLSAVLFPQLLIQLFLINLMIKSTISHLENF